MPTPRTRIAALSLAFAVISPAVSPDEGPATTPDAAAGVSFEHDAVTLTDNEGERVAVELPGHRVARRRTGADYRGAGFTLRSRRDAAWATTIIEIPGADAPRALSFGLRLPDRWTAELLADGSVAIGDGAGERRGTIAPPWAHDAEGNAIPTSFSLTGTTLVQTIDHHGAVYPVTADPSITLGRNVYLWVRGYEIGWWGSSSAAFLSAYMCAAYGSLHPVMCAVGATGALWLIAAFDDVFSTDRCRYVIAVRYWGWPNYMERLSRDGCTYRKSDIPG